jgi:hypothetical protein
MTVSIAFDGLSCSRFHLVAQGVFDWLKQQFLALAWIFRERLSSFDDCTPSISIAIVPSDAGWTAVTNSRQRTKCPRCVRRIEQIQKQLRGVYVLSED